MSGTKHTGILKNGVFNVDFHAGQKNLQHLRNESYHMMLVPFDGVVFWFLFSPVWYKSCGILCPWYCVVHRSRRVSSLARWKLENHRTFEPIPSAGHAKWRLVTQCLWSLSLRYAFDEGTLFSTSWESEFCSKRSQDNKHRLGWWPSYWMWLWGVLEDAAWMCA